MSSGNAIRGSRVGAGPMGEAERGEAAPRVWVSFWCANKHETRPSFATDAAIPDRWWAYGAYADGTPIEKAHRVLYRQRADLQQAFPDPFAAGEGGYSQWLEREGL